MTADHDLGADRTRCRVVERTLRACWLVLRTVLAGVLVAAAASACTDSERSDDPTTATSAPPSHRVAECPATRPDCLDRAEMADLERQLRIEPSDELLYAVQVPDAGVPTVFVVLQDQGGGRVGACMTDADRDGTFVDTNSQGLKPPAYVARSKRSAVGTAFFTSDFFAFAATHETEAVQVVLRTAAAERRVPVNESGVSDLTAEWLSLRAVGDRFSVEWIGPDGDVLDDLHGSFPGVVD